MADYERFLWAVEPETGDERLIGIDFGLLGTDIPQDLVERFLRWHGRWSKSRQYLFDPAGAEGEASNDEQFHAEGRALAEQLQTVIKQPVDYRP